LFHRVERSLTNVERQRRGPRGPSFDHAANRVADGAERSIDEARIGRLCNLRVHGFLARMTRPAPEPSPKKRTFPHFAAAYVPQEAQPCNRGFPPDTSASKQGRTEPRDDESDDLEHFWTTRVEDLASGGVGGRKRKGEPGSPEDLQSLVELAERLTSGLENLDQKTTRRSRSTRTLESCLITLEQTVRLVQKQLAD
jgi:hypothetical protein